VEDLRELTPSEMVLITMLINAKGFLIRSMPNEVMTPIGFQSWMYGKDELIKKIEKLENESGL